MGNITTDVTEMYADTHTHTARSTTVQGAAKKLPKT